MIVGTAYSGKPSDFSPNADVIKPNFVINENCRSKHSISRNVFCFLKNLQASIQQLLLICSNYYRDFFPNRHYTKITKFCLFYVTIFFQQCTYFYTDVFDSSNNARV